MKAMIFGASGMVGGGVLLECIEHPEVSSILVIGRTPSGVTHQKLEEILHQDFFDFTEIENRLEGFDACFFCLGVSAAGTDSSEKGRIMWARVKGATENRRSVASDLRPEQRPATSRFLAVGDRSSLYCRLRLLSYLANLILKSPGICASAER